MAAVSASLVKELRDQTGAGMMDCKRALEEANGDLEAAKRLLRERGMASAAKRAGRETTEGLVGYRISDTHGTMVAQAGATTKETMRRLGQSTIQAAMIYQHATDERDQSIAKAIGDAVEAAMEAARIEAEKRRREADDAG